MSDNTSMREAMHTAIQKVLHDQAQCEGDRGILINWALTLQAVGSGGCPWLRHIASESLASWIEAGMLISALDDVRAQMRENTIDFNSEEDDQ